MSLPRSVLTVAGSTSQEITAVRLRIPSEAGSNLFALLK